MTDPIEIADAFAVEYLKARKKFARFNSLHEGYAVLKEEVDELWDEIKSKGRTRENLRKEAIQIGAMALAIIADLDL